ncbi:MAG: class I SAM-dependent methyltransferase [Verrucomicrobiota bacterium]
MINEVESADWRTLVAKKPGIHAWPPGQLSFFSLPDDVLQHLAALSNEETNTLETGLGASTIVFACQRSHHFCITPGRDEIERMEAFCRREGVSTDHVTFIGDYSEAALPRLALPPLDLVLIDGRHGFPAPMLDWYYSCKHLKIGGQLIVDDIQLWPVQVLIEYLSSSSHWKLERAFQRTLSYVRTGAGDESAEWIHQLNVERKTTELQLRMEKEQRMQKARALAARGRFDLLAGKVLRTVTRRLRT